MRVTLTVNGAHHELDVDPARTLADVLGAECGVTGHGVTCPDGTCDACAVVMDGDRIRSCLVLAVQADGTQVSTAALR